MTPGITLKILFILSNGMGSKRVKILDPLPATSAPSVALKKARHERHQEVVATPSLPPSDSESPPDTEGSALEDAATEFTTKWISVKKLKAMEQELGTTYRKGKFTNKERATIEGIIGESVRDLGMSREQLVNDIFNGRGKKRFADLFTKTAVALDRPVILVYHYMRRLLHPGNRAGSWTRQEDATLRRLFAIKGPMWAEIAKEIGRFATACRDRYRNIRMAYAHGQWTAEETQRLVDAVNELMASRRRHREAAAEADAIPLTLSNEESTPSPPSSAITWHYVSERVQTRSFIQCLTKWSSIAYKTRHGQRQGPRWTDALDLQLCHQLYDLCVDDESEVTWGKLLESVPHWVNMFTADRLRSRWTMLRRRVLNANRMEMDTVLETLINYLQSSEVSIEDLTDDEL